MATDNTEAQASPAEETELVIGPSSINAYSRLSYTMWHALAEFIDNSTQSRLNYGNLIEDILKHEGQPLVVEISHDRLARTITIKDNSIGMTKGDLIEALKIAHPTKDSRGRSKYGMGMKTAACWIGSRWKVVTVEWDSGEEWTADVDVVGIANGTSKIPLTPKAVGKDEHYTQILISGLNRNIQTRTEETIRAYLGSMYRFDLISGNLRLLYNGQEIKAPDEAEFDTDPSGKPMKRDLPDTEINGKKVTGWVGVLKKGGRKYGGFSLFQNKRQIKGFPGAWKPNSIFGGVDDEGANNLVSQRLVGLLELDGFEVSHTKDAILFRDDEEEDLEKLLDDFTKDYRDYAAKRRGTKTTTWSKEKIRDLVESMKQEFISPELQDAVNTTILPPLETIVANNQKQLESLTDSEKITTMEVLPDLRVIVSLQEKSEWEPYVTIVAAAEAGTIHVIINALHPYYSSLESSDSLDECMKQYIYDALAEYRVSKLNSKLTPDSVRRIKNDFLKANVLHIENVATATQSGSVETSVAINGDTPPNS